MLLTRPDKPVDPLTVTVLDHVDRVVKSLNMQYVVLGATARDVLLTHVHGLEIERATSDVDLAVMCESWAAFRAVKHALISTGHFEQDPEQIQRLRYEPTQRSRGYPVDILPFGGVEAVAGEILWPPDAAIRMNVLGYAEALRGAQLVQIAHDTRIPFPTLPNLAAVKLLAWQDRRNRTTKDALDLAQLIRTYGQAGTQERLYGEASDILEAAQYDLQKGGAKLLGVDMRAAVMTKTMAAMRALLADAELRDELLCHMAPAFRADEDKYAAAEILLTEVRLGLG